VEVTLLARSNGFPLSVKLEIETWFSTTSSD
jgi:hypothetical protein